MLRLRFRAAMLAHRCSFVNNKLQLWQHLFVIVLRECLQCRQGLSDIPVVMIYF